MHKKFILSYVGSAKGILILFSFTFLGQMASADELESSFTRRSLLRITENEIFWKEDCVRRLSLGSSAPLYREIVRQVSRTPLEIVPKSVLVQRIFEAGLQNFNLSDEILEDRIHFVRLGFMSVDAKFNALETITLAGYRWNEPLADDLADTLIVAPAEDDIDPREIGKNLVYAPAQNEILYQGKYLPIRKSFLALFRALSLNAHRITSAEELAMYLHQDMPEKVYSRNGVNLVRVQLSKLRAFLRTLDTDAQIIPVHGRGYQLVRIAKK